MTQITGKITQVIHLYVIFPVIYIMYYETN